MWLSSNNCVLLQCVIADALGCQVCPCIDCREIIFVEANTAWKRTDIIFVKTFTLADFGPILFYPKERNSRHYILQQNSVKYKKKSTPLE